MRRTLAIILILTSISFLQYFGITEPMILTSVGNFFVMLKSVSLGHGDFAYFLHTTANVLISISIIFLCFGALWIALDLIVSKEKDFVLVLTRNPIILISSGTGLLFAGQFMHSFSNMLQIKLLSALLGFLIAIACLETTMRLLEALGSEAKHFKLKISFTQR